MNLLRMIGNGFATMADPYVDPRAYKTTTTDGWKKDNDNLRGDVYVVGTGMRKAISNGRTNAAARNK